MKSARISRGRNSVLKVDGASLIFRILKVPDTKGIRRGFEFVSAIVTMG
jgi:hypothetical protein